MLKRTIQTRIQKSLFQGKAIIIYGARQVGKTTLLHQIQKDYPKISSMFLNCDEPDIRESLTNVTSTQLKKTIGKNRLVFIDEAQRVKNIGLTIKLIVDNYPKIQVVATGSSSLDLSNEIIEPLTGRKYEFYLFPFSLQELNLVYSKIEINRLLEDLLIYGSYPDIIIDKTTAVQKLEDITRSYLYKDVLQYQQLKSPDLLDKLLKAIALQIGNEVSYSELGNLLEIDKNTVARYVDLLEKSFIVFRLKPFSRNLRQELNKMQKIYFWDLGVRNALIRSQNPLSLRNDIGSLWENFIIIERQKLNGNNGRLVNSYFWRTYQQQEIDYLEEENTNLSAYEIKWQDQKVKPPALFLSTYPNATFSTITRSNFFEFLK